MITKFLQIYLIAFSLAVHVGVFVAVFFALQHFDLTPRQAISKLLEKSGVDDEILSASLRPSARYIDHVLDGQISARHPRIVLPELAKLSAEARISFFSERMQRYRDSSILPPPYPCGRSILSALTTCWITTGDPAAFNRALQELLNLQVETPQVSTRYGNGWQLALNYDLLASSSKLTESQHARIQSKLESAIVGYLRLLDGDSASLWHGRLSLASNLWLCAMMLDANTDARRNLLVRGQDYRYYVETDGDDSTLNGRNMHAGVVETSWSDAAAWRTEIFSSAAAKEHRFLITLAPATGGEHPVRATFLATSNPANHGVVLGATAIIFVPTRGQFSVRLHTSTRLLYLVGSKSEPRLVTSNCNTLHVSQHANTVTRVLLPSGSAEKHIRVHH